MAGQKPIKSFWKKYEYVIVAIVTLAFIYALVFFNQKINFLLGNELIVYLEPHQASFSAHYGDVNEAKFNISIDNVAYCKASCSYSFNDRSRNVQIDKGTFQIGKKHNVVKTYNLSVKRLGSGQDIYSFDLNCRSIRAYLCLTKGNDKSRSSLAVVNYDLTETEKKLKDSLRQNVTNLLEELRNTDILHQQINQKYFELSFKVNMQNLSRQKIEIDDFYDKTRVEIENFRSLWSTENYLKLDELFNESFSDRLNKTMQSLIELNMSINELVELHNNLLSELNDIYNKSTELNDIANILESGELQHNSSTNIADIYEIASSLNNNTFENYSVVAEEITEVRENQDSLAESIRFPALRLFFDIIYNLNFEEDLLCLKQGCKTNNSVLQLINEIERLNNNYPNSPPLKISCNSLRDFGYEISEARNEALSLIEKNNISFPDGKEFIEVADSFENNLIKEINNSYFNSFSLAKQENKTTKEIFEIMGLFFPGSITIALPLTYNDSVNLSLYALSKSGLLEKSKQLLNQCSRINKSLGLNLSLERVSAEINYTATSSIEISLSDNPPICCVFNDCKACCRNNSCRDDPKTFPVIFLHGHSLAKSNSPEFSLDSFNKLQEKLQDDGYLNAGIVSLYSKNELLEPGEWGSSGKPVTVKVSYYYDAFRKDDKYIVVPTKSENIDTYSLRLKELIEIVKQRTNKPKVNIIAHSMGGLVARRYVQIFGGEDIDKLVMIATPNNGISGSASSYCGIIGENRECLDMQENSLFLNKLNDISNKPTKLRQYMIIGKGCKTDGKDGDGIVVAENAELKGAELYSVNGSCSGLFGKVLHTGILDVDEYPETYEIVAEILKE